MKLPSEFSEKSRNLLLQLESDPFSHELFADLQPLLIQWLLKVPDPDQALNHFVRFTQEVVSKTSLYKLLLQYPHFLEILLRVFASSNYLADILIRHPEYFYWLTTIGINQPNFDKEIFETEQFREHLLPQAESKKWSRLKRLRRREILRIGTLDILGWNRFQATVENLSDLADAILQAGLLLVERELEPQFGTPALPFVVLGLGKLGGRELNYSSDIDIMFIYAEEGTGKRRDTGQSFSYNEYFNRLSEKYVRWLSEFSEGEALYRVDTRLRPEGQAGPLARSAASMLHYYEIRGRLWERQMLIKARPVAGDLNFGFDFLRRLRHFIYPASFFRSPLEEIRRIKETIEEKLYRHGQGDTNIKLSQGGIRDVEFTVQALQLLNGGRLPDLQQSGTLCAIQKLAKHRLLTDSEVQILREAYIFFRKVEHYLQLEDWRQTHLLPEDPHRRLVLAKKLGFQDWHHLREALRKQTALVRSIYNTVLQTGSPDHARNGFFPIENSKALSRAGFQNPGRAQGILKRLAYGTREKPATSHEREAFLQFISAHLNEIGQTPQPEETLQNLENLIRAYGSPKNLCHLLKENEKFRQLFLTLAAKSHLLVQLFTTEPDYFRLLLNPAEWQQKFTSEHFRQALALQRKAFDQENFNKHLFYLKHFFQLCTGIQFLRSAFPLPLIFQELSDLADTVTLEFFHHLIMKHWQEEPFPAEIFALGKWGVHDLNFGSDLDVLFLTRSEDAIPEQEKIVRAFLAGLAQITPAGQLYKIDARLRAEGSSAPLLISFHSYQNYLLNRGQLWERQALLRLRPVESASLIWRNLESFLNTYLFDSGLSDRQQGEIFAMLAKIHGKALTKRRRELDFKNAPGGIVDIEFLTQIFQLKYGKNEMSLRRNNTVALLENLKNLSLLSQPDADFLIESYLFYRKIEAILHLGLQKRRAALPLETPKLQFVARAADFQNEERFLKEMEKRMTAVKHIWQRLFD